MKRAWQRTEVEMTTPKTNTTPETGNLISHSHGKCGFDRTDTVDALAEATATHLRMLGRWQPGTLAALLAPSSLPGARRVDQLLGEAVSR